MINKLLENPIDIPFVKIPYSYVVYDVIRIPKINAITQSINLYTYCGNNPIIYFDPSGYGFWRSVGNVAKSTVKGAVVGAGAGAVGGAFFDGVGALPGALAGGATGAVGGLIEGVLDEIWP